MPKYGIGQPVRRLEDRRFLTGAGQFVDDINLPHQCYGVVLYSPYAHAKIARIDVSQALNSPGVVCVLTGADVVADGLGGMPPLFMPGGGGRTAGVSDAYGQFSSLIGSAVWATALPSWLPKRWLRRPTG